jgi:hypothetical protein
MLLLSRSEIPAPAWQLTNARGVAQGPESLIVSAPVDTPDICDVWNQRSYEMPARPRALKRVFSDARVRLPGASASATFMAE